MYPKVIPIAVLYPNRIKLEFSPISAAHMHKTSMANAVAYRFLTFLKNL
jgi:hypothetical protein